MPTVPTLRRNPGGIRVSTCVAVGLAGAIATVALPGPAYADAESELVNKVTKLNKRAIDEYENLNFEEARKILKDALDLCTQGGLERHPITARTYVDLGVVALSGFKQRDAALKYFRKALEIDHGVKLTKALANPEVQEAFDAAGGGGAPAGAARQPAAGA